MQARLSLQKRSYIATPGAERKFYCTVPERILDYAKRTPEKEAIVFVGRNSRIGVTYSDIAIKAETMARKLWSLGIRPGEIVNIQEDKSPMWIYSTVAVQLCGAWPLHFYFVRKDGSDAVTTFKSANCSTIITPAGDDDIYVKIMKTFITFDDSNGKVFSEDVTSLKQVIFTSKPSDLENALTMDSLPPLTENVNLPELEPEDIAAIFCSSGSSGNLKLIPYTHTNLISDFYGYLKLIDYRKEESFFCDRPFSWVFCYPFDFLFGRTRVTTSSVFKELTIKEVSENTVRIIRNETCQHGILSPSTMYYIAQNEHKMEPLKSISTAGGPLSANDASVGKKLCNKFLNVYGLTECGHVTANIVEDTKPVVNYDAGVPLPGAEVKVVEPSGRLSDVGEYGEIYIRQLTGSTGYVQGEQAWHKENRTVGYWLKTGDAGYISTNGHLFVTGRIAESIIVEGQIVSPTHFENILKRNPKIESAVAFAIPDKKLFNVPGIAVVLKETDSQTEEEVLTNYREKEMIYFKDSIHAAWAEPKRIIFFDKFPLLSNGKIARSEVKKMALDRI